jgi:hypothetical protein
LSELFVIDESNLGFSVKSDEKDVALSIAQICKKNRMTDFDVSIDDEKRAKVGGDDDVSKTDSEVRGDLWCINHPPPILSLKVKNNKILKEVEKEMSESVSEEEKKIVYFHGKDIRDEKIQKMIRKKASLTRAILLNAVLITGIIVVLFILTLLGG